MRIAIYASPAVLLYVGLLRDNYIRMNENIKAKLLSTTNLTKKIKDIHVNNDIYTLMTNHQKEYTKYSQYSSIKKILHYNYLTQLNSDIEDNHSRATNIHYKENQLDSGRYF